MIDQLVLDPLYLYFARKPKLFSSSRFEQIHAYKRHRQHMFERNIVYVMQHAWLNIQIEYK